MKIKDILNEDSAVNPEDKPMTADQIAELERFADSEFEKYDLDVEFTRHFIERLTDARGGRNAPLTFTDVKKLFSKMANQRGAEIADFAMDGGEGGIMKDKETSVNSPFGIKYNRATREYELVMVTVMRHPNFRSNNPNDKIFTTESIHAPLIRKAMNLVESGNAVEGVGPIAREELLPTLKAVEADLGINLSDVTLGSAAKNRAGGIGKKAFSGDIDATVNIQPGEDESFKEKLDRSSIIMSHVKHGNTISTKVKIVDYDPNRENPNGTIPDGRTGYVQLDFMPGDFDWNSFYFHSPEEGTSKYKGGYRTVLLATIASIHDVVPVGDETTEDGRPVQVERWKFSPTEGLVRIRRTLNKRKDGKGYTKSATDEIIGEPIRKGEQVTKALDLGNVDTADSFETLWAAVKANYPEHEVEEIKQAFLRTSNVARDGVPDELKEWVPLAVAAGQAAMAGARMAAPHVARAAAAAGRSIAQGARNLFKGNKNPASKAKQQRQDRAKDITKRDPSNFIGGGAGSSNLDIEQQNGADMWRRHRGSKR